MEAAATFTWETNARQRLVRWAPTWTVVGFLYLPAVFGLRHVAPKLRGLRRPIRVAWGLWNAATAVFSMAGYVMTARAFIETARGFGASCTLAGAPYSLDGPVGRWAFYFIVSKLFELADTLFLAALEKPFGFLHWYHHASIFVYMFLAGLDWHPHMISGVAWNYGVHSAMYAYYACACFGWQWPRPLARSITMLQIGQMVCQCVLTVASICVCGATSLGHLPGLAMYAVYLVLFCEFFVGRWLGLGGAKGVAKKDL